MVSEGHPGHGWSSTRGSDGLFRRHADADLQRRDALRALGELVIRSERDGDRHVVAPIGVLDVMTARLLDNELEHAEATDAREILVDLTGLQFISSAGLKVFLQAAARSRAHGNRLTILRGPDTVHRTFEISGLATRLPYIDHEELTSPA
ncbi:MAG: STAS domain-containing protein [Solirubrobacteraceae bacterium]